MALVVILGLIVSLIQTPQYKSSAKLLVIFSQKDMNPYTSAQTSNYIAGILAEVVYSNSFIDNVFKTNFNLKNDLGFSQDEQIKNWKKMVKVKLQDNTGIIIIDVYNQDREQANNFAQAIGYTLITNNSLYHGSGDSVAVKMIGVPNVANKWAKPDIFQNILLSWLAGLFIGLTFIIIFPEQELISFVFGKKIISRDEVIVFENITSQDNLSGQSEVGFNTPTGQNKTGGEYYNW